MEFHNLESFLLAGYNEATSDPTHSLRHPQSATAAATTLSQPVGDVHATDQQEI